MTKSSQNDTDLQLDALFAELRQDPAVLPENLMAAILADANALQPPATTLAAKPALRPWWQGLSEALGGWQAASALAACGVVGLGVGLYAPDSLSEFSSLVLNFDATSGTTDDLYSTLDDMLTES